MILGRRVDLWTGAVAATVNVLVLLAVLDWAADVVAGFNVAVGMILALLANTDRPVHGQVLEVRDTIKKWTATRS